MHDPLHIVLSIRRPWGHGRTDARPRDARSFAFWTVRGATVCNAAGDDIRTPLRRRLNFHPAFFRLGGREWYLPALVTVWHRDPERDGTDSSCRNAARVRMQAAVKDRRWLAAAALEWWWRHHDLFHVHHWTVQFDLAQELRRRLFTRCSTCGGRSTGKRVVNVRIVVDRDAEDRRREQCKTLRGRWLTGEANLHHWDCTDLASVRATKAGLGDWLRCWGSNEATMAMQREREPYYGCYPWWREAILGEDPETAALLASLHVQRSVSPCRDCGGSGQRVTGTVTARMAARGPQHNPLMGVVDRQACEPCDGTGHPRVKKPIPAAAV